MASNAPQDSNPVIKHNKLAITLLAAGLDTAHINPDFLRYNGIVESGWQAVRPVIIESNLSIVEYTNGLEFTAEENYITISHSGQPLAIEEIITADVASRYLEAAPYFVEYNSIITDWRGEILFGDDGLALQNSPLRELAQSVEFAGIVPTMQARAVYVKSSDESIRVYLSEFVEGDVITKIQFDVHIYRDLDDVPSEEREAFIRSVLENWKEDIADCEKLACRFYSAYVR